MTKHQPFMKKALLTLVVTLIFLHSVRGQACVGSESLTATPPPSANGTYYPGTVVTFCYTVTDYAQNGVDWFCGAVPTLGPGWDLSTLQPISAPASCDGQGNWAWYTSCTGTASGLTFGPGFYYDSPAGSTSGTLDGIPGNNFGDNCPTYVWTFCFSVQVSATAPSGTSLNVTMTAYSDYMVGSWGTDGCQDPPNPSNTLNATVAICTLVVPTVNVTNATCPNSNDGSLTVIPSGIPPYTYLWNTGATTSTINNLPSGIYTVTVTDSTLCDKVVTIPVGGPLPIASNATVINDGCNPNGGSITLAPSGGNGSAYTFLWNTGATTTALTNLAAGTYIVTITDSLSCTEVDTFNLISVIPVTLTTSSTSTVCGSSNGTATATPSGGLPPYSYSWSPTGGSGATASNLAAGTYTVTVTDAAGCTADAQVQVQASGTFTLTTQFVPLACDPLGTTTASVSITGGTPPFTYSWSPIGGTQQTGTGLVAGTYIVLVTDSNNCVDSATVTIPAVIPLSLTTGATPVLCGIPNSGTASVIATGGSGVYTYMWSDGSTTSTASNLPGGVYTVTVTDSQGCTSTATSTVNVLPEVFASAGTGQTVCSGQPANLLGAGSGGTMPFQYSWSNGSTTGVITVNPVTTTTYILTVTDANNCTDTDSVVITVQDYPVVIMSPDATICFGSGTTISASGGSNYTWSPGTGLSNPGIDEPFANPTVTTTYFVNVSNGLCAITDSVTVTVAPQVTASFNPDTIAGEAPLTVTFNNNSSGGLTYSWNFGDGNSSTDESPSNTYTDHGNYTVTMIATNAFGCSDTVTYEFITVDEFASLTVPNIFSPNGDGKNDVFGFIEKGISS